MPRNIFIADLLIRRVLTSVPKSLGKGGDSIGAYSFVAKNLSEESILDEFESMLDEEITPEILGIYCNRKKLTEYEHAAFRKFLAQQINLWYRKLSKLDDPSMSDLEKFHLELSRYFRRLKGQRSKKVIGMLRNG